MDALATPQSPPGIRVVATGRAGSTRQVAQGPLVLGRSARLSQGSQQQLQASQETPSNLSDGGLGPSPLHRSQPSARRSQRAQSPLAWPKLRKACRDGSPDKVVHDHVANATVAGLTSAAATVADDEEFVERLVRRGLLCNAPRAGLAAGEDDLACVNALFSFQLQDIKVLRVLRVENKALDSVYEAFRGAMGTTLEMDLWHGTTPDCVQNIVLNGFNRAYSGRHGTKLGLGTYFSADAAYSLRFCGRRPRGRRVMLLAGVLVGACTKGSPDLVEPPYRDEEQMTRYDTTVDDATAPSTFCVFRDYQASAVVSAAAVHVMSAPLAAEVVC